MRFRRILWVGLLFLSGFIFLWGMIPIGYQVQSVLISAAELKLSMLNEGAALPDLANPDAPVAQISLKKPAHARVGDSAVLRLSFEPNGAINPRVKTPLVIHTRLELSGIQHNPTGEISQKLTFDHPVEFLWYLRPKAPGRYTGKAWLYVSIAEGENRAESRQVLSAQQFDTRVTTLCGLSGTLARSIGIVGIAVGAGLGLQGKLLVLLQRITGPEP